jgi:hypothetical protein
VGLPDFNFKLHHVNPCIAAVDKGLIIYWRISDIFFHPAADRFGEPVYSTSYGKNNAVASGLISKKQLLDFCEIEESRIVIEPSGDLGSVFQHKADTNSRIMDYDDPRVIEQSPNLLLLHGRYLQDSVD